MLGDLPLETQKKLVAVDQQKGYGLKKVGNVYVFSDGSYEVLIVNSRKGLICFQP